jgi:hypothetical protein
LSASIGKAIREPDARILKLEQVALFDWDAVFLFPPYTPKDRVCYVLRVDDHCASVVPFESTDDGLMTLAFRRSGVVVRVEQHSRANGDFTPVPVAQPIPRSRAVFEIVRERQGSGGGSDWRRLVLQ